MTKARITTNRRAGRIVVVTGQIMGGVSLGLLLAFNCHLTQVHGGGYTFVPRLDGAFWTTTRLTLAAGVVILVGLALPLVAWTEALVNKYKLQKKTWFAALLVGTALQPDWVRGDVGL